MFNAIVHERGTIPNTTSYYKTTLRKDQTTAPKRLFLNPFSESLAGEADHAPADHGFVVDGETFVVTDTSAVSGNPGQRPFYDPASGQDNESLQVVGSLHDLQPPGGDAVLPNDELAGIAGVDPHQLDAPKMRS
jgi:hypothetical protein